MLFPFRLLQLLMLLLLLLLSFPLLAAQCTLNSTWCHILLKAPLETSTDSRLAPRSTPAPAPTPTPTATATAAHVVRAFHSAGEICASRQVRHDVMCQQLNSQRESPVASCARSAEKTYRARARARETETEGAACKLRLEARATGNWNVAGDELQSLHALWACGMWHVACGRAVAVAVTVAVAAPFV